jgi:signal transduction histidine kinase
MLHLADEERHVGAACGELRALGIEVIARLGEGGERLGLVLLGGSRSRLPYTSAQLAFLRQALALTAVATQRARLARQLLAAERFATLGRVGAGLIHDLGKSLGVVERLAARLPRDAGDLARSRRDAHTIALLAAEMRVALRGFLATGAAGAGGDGEAAVDALVDRAIRMVARAPARVAVRLAPGLPRLRAGGDELVRVLANLVDNACRASAPDEVVSVAAVEEAGELRFEVSDRGCGMDAALVARACEPFFTTRAANGGSGLGLSICRELVASLGGSLELCSAPGAGTRARVRLPLAPPGEPHAA